VPELPQPPQQYSLGDVRDPLARWITVPMPVPLRLVIRSALLNALAFTSGDQRAAAEYLGITARMMNYQLEMHAIPRKGTGLGRHKAKAARAFKVGPRLVRTRRESVPRSAAKGGG
jgi:hypothetical protein